jgi:hypothetical protein
MSIYVAGNVKAKYWNLWSAEFLNHKRIGFSNPDIQIQDYNRGLGHNPVAADESLAR